MAVLLARPHTPKIETVNDADCFLSNFWRAIQADPEAVAYWADWPVNECDLHARHLWLVTEGRQHVERLKSDPDYHDAKIAGWWVWGLSQWIGSGWCPERREPSRQLPAVAGVKGVHNTSVDVPRQTPRLAGNYALNTPNPPVARQVPHLTSDGMGVHAKIPHLTSAGTGGYQSPPDGLYQKILQVAGGAHRLEWLIEWFSELSARLRMVRVCCGDWSRVVTPAVTFGNGLTAVFLDPPYSQSERANVYAVESTVAGAVREWAVANGDNPLLRVALCGYDGEHAMPESWSVVRWKATGGYGVQGSGRGLTNRERETIWFSPSCLGPEYRQVSLFEATA